MKKTLSFVIICSSVFLMTGCGKDALNGTWNSATNDELNSTFEFDGKGNVYYKNDYYEHKGTYSIDENTVIISDVWDEDKKYTFKKEKGKLSLNATDLYSPSYLELKKK